MHISVGAIIRIKHGAIPPNGTIHSNWNKEDKILMLDRAYFPFGWACPAGHADKGENPEQALKREIKEETGLKIKTYKLLIHEFVEWNKCVKGVKGHDWYVYEVGEWQGEIKQNKREVKEIDWFNPDEIKKLELEQVWSYWFKKLRII